MFFPDPNSEDLIHSTRDKTGGLKRVSSEGDLQKRQILSSRRSDLRKKSQIMERHAVDRRREL